jgi:cobalt-zinc-cadmium efflux system protein
MKNLMMQEDLSNENQEVCSIADCPPYSEAYDNFDTERLPTFKSHHVQLRCDNTHSHTPHIHEGNKKAYRIAIGLNAALVLIELIAGICCNSTALLTDAGHNFGDVVGLAFSLIASSLAKKQPSAGYTYGFKKTTVLAGFVNVLILFIAMGILGSGAFIRLFNPEVPSSAVTAWVAALGMIINGISAFLFFRQKHELNSRAAYLHQATDAVVSFVVVFIGIAIHFTHLYWLDPVISLIIVIVILFRSWSLLKDSFKMIIDAVPSGIEVSKIEKVITSVSHVQSVHHVHVWSLSTTENALTAQVVIDEQLSFEKKLRVIREIKLKLEHCNIHHSTIEPSKNTGSKALKSNDSGYLNTPAKLN